jgi:predicted ArsR family transcriptional regulator
MSSTTKAEILALLKRNGGHSVGELASSLDLAPMTVRHHLTHLERDGLVLAEKRNGTSSGRPSYRFRLTAKAHAAAFPRRSDRLAELLIREVGRLDGRDIEGLSATQKTSLVLERLAGRLADEYAPLLTDWALQERIAFVTEVMHADGGFAEWERTAKGYEIRDFNCLFHRLLNGDGAAEACTWHATFLSRTLGAEVRVLPCPDSSERCCRFIVSPAPAAVREPQLARA